MVRFIPQLRDPIDPRGLGELTTLDEIVQARIDGAITRRQLIRRAGQIGLAAPVVGVMLHLTSDMAAGAPSGGREATLRRMRGQELVPVTGPTAPAGTKVEGGTLVVGTIEEPDTLHPHITQLVTTSDVLNGVYNALMVYDSTQTIQPALATEMSVSEDGLVYTFQLRQGVAFHNEEPFAAKDVIALHKAIMDPEYGAYSQLGWDQITKIDAPDDFTVVMTTEKPYAPFVTYVAADPVSSMIVPASVIEKGAQAYKDELTRTPIGTGPFQVTEWKAKEQITLVRNDAYWGTRPTLDSIVYRIIPDDNSQLVQLQTGEIQLAAGAGSISSARVDEALTFEGVSILESGNFAWNHLDLKHVDFLRMTKVRQALDFATPTQDIIDRILKGRVTRAFADQAPGTWAYNDSVQPRPYDLERAKALLAEAGLTQNGDGVWEGPTPNPESDDPNTDLTGPVKPLELEFWSIAGDSTTAQIAQVIGQSWNSIGIKTELKSEDVSTIWAPEGYQYNDKMTACMYSWFNGNEPDDMYYWHSTQIPDSPTGSGGNAVAYFHPMNFQAEIDRLTSEAVAVTDQAQRKALYDQVQALLAEEVPVIFLWWGKEFSGVSNKVGGFWPSAFNRLMWNAQDWYLVE